MNDPDYRELLEECCRVGLKAGHDATRPYVGSLVWYDGSIISEGYVMSADKKVKKKKEKRRGGRSGPRGSSVQIGRKIDKKKIRVHAEEMCLRNLSRVDSYNVRESILVTSLEPCIPGSRTGPIGRNVVSCCELIIESGIRKVVVGELESSQSVPKNFGVNYLRGNGIEVIYDESLADIVKSSQVNYLKF